MVSWGTSSELAQQLLEGCHDRCNCLNNVTADVCIHPGDREKNKISFEIQAAATADSTQGCIEPVNNSYALCDADATGLNVATTAVITRARNRFPLPGYWLLISRQNDEPNRQNGPKFPPRLRRTWWRTAPQADIQHRHTSC